MKDKVEVLVIGAGSAGLAAVTEVRRQTDDFLLVSQGIYGTSCARVACMPTKTLGEAARLFHGRKALAAMGGRGLEQLELPLPAVLEHVKRLRDGFVAGVVEHTRDLGDRSIAAPVRFLAPTVLEIGGQRIETERVIIATGSSPVVPEEWRRFEPWLITTDRFFALDDLPPRMAVIGLGPSGLEFAQSLARLGVEIEAFERGAMVGGLTDPEVNGAVLRDLGEEFRLTLQVEVLPASSPDGLLLKAGDRKTVVPLALLCLGRRPNLAGLGLENLGLPTDDLGIPEFDHETLRIGDLPIFIAGDANGYRPILHEVIDEGHFAGYNAVSTDIHRFRRRTPLVITYTEPDIALVGAPWEELRDRRDVVVGAYDFRRQARARMGGRNRGLLRLYLDRSDGRLLGAELAAPGGEHLAHLLAWSLEQELTVYDLLRFPFYHPSVEEGLRTALRDGMDQLSCDKPEVELLVCRCTPEQSLC